MTKRIVHIEVGERLLAFIITFPKHLFGKGTITLEDQVIPFTEGFIRKVKNDLDDLRKEFMPPKHPMCRCILEPTDEDEVE
jgi:hypothetical protein